MKTCYIDLKLLYNELEDIEKMLIPLLTIIGNKGIEHDVLIYNSEPYEKEAQMNFSKKVIDECELETLRLDNARLREENENLKVSFREDTKLLDEYINEIFNLHSEMIKIKKYLDDKNKEIDFYKKEARGSKQALYRLKEEITTYLESLPI